jgi:hypothetical protein
MNKETNSSPGKIETSKDLLAWLNAILEDTWAQENSTRRSKTIGYLLNVTAKHLAYTETDERLDRLELNLHKITGIHYAE